MITTLAVCHVVVQRYGSDLADVGVLLVGAAFLVVLTRAAGLTVTDLGLDSAQLRGSRWLSVGAAAAAGLALVLIAIAPLTRHFLTDVRFVGVGFPEALSKLVVTIPLNVAFEELAFRGLLLGLLLRHVSSRSAVVGSSVLFGLWHVIPTSEQVATTWPGLAAPFAVIAVAGVVGVTAAAGAVFAWLRLRCGSVLAPLLAHGTLNGTAYLLGWAIVRWQL